MPRTDAEERKAYLRQYYLKHQVHLLAERSKYCKANREKINTRVKQAYKENRHGKRDRCLAQAKAWGKAHPEERKLSTHKARLKYVYGINYAEYDRMRLAQGGKCLICGGSPPRLCIDHCHTSGRVRGLLCNDCNLALGHMKDSIFRLESAIRYLKVMGG